MDRPEATSAVKCALVDAGALVRNHSPPRELVLSRFNTPLKTKKPTNRLIHRLLPRVPVGRSDASGHQFTAFAGCTCWKSSISLSTIFTVA